MRVTSIGGGPGGLYSGILLKKAHPDWSFTLHERNAPSDTFGFGVVFSSATLGELDDADPESFAAIIDASARWDPVDIHYRGQRIRGRGNGFAAISRKRLLNILQERARELGVQLHFSSEVDDPAAHLDADLVIAADGVNSGVRARFADAFGPRLTRQGGKFIWLGTTKVFDSFTFIFKENEHGWFQVHGYPYDEHMSTFIVECDEGTWRAAGLDRHEHDPLPPGHSDMESIAYCRQLFAEELDGHELVANNSKWLDWRTVRNRTWRRGNVVLLGDAAHTAHFSIGSGTKLAMEDAIALAHALERHDDLDDALQLYEANRRAAVERVQAAAEESLSWFERYQRYTGFEPPQFAYSLLTRSRRVTHENLRKRDPRFLSGFERWYAERAGVGSAPLVVAPQPAFTPLRLRGLTLANRLVLATGMDHAAVKGQPSPDQLASARALAGGGGGVLLAESVAVADSARVTPGCWGLYDESHADAWQELVDAAHAGGSAVSVQLSHAGPRGATRPRTRGTDRPLREGAWDIVAASALPYRSGGQVPVALDADGMAAVREDFTAAAERAAAAGADIIEIHAGAGYLLASFVSPLTNRREDAYGGDLPGRMAFPLEVVAAVRAVWPQDRPLSVCFSASDLQPGGLTADEAVAAARLFAGAGADLLHVVAGQTTPRYSPTFEPAYHSGWADLVRNGARIPTVTSGDIPDHARADDVLAAGLADLCVVGRPALREPEWRRDPRWRRESPKATR